MTAMNLRIALPVLALAFISAEGCATAPPQGTASTTTPRRRRRQVAQPANVTAHPASATAAATPTPVTLATPGLALVPTTPRPIDRRDGGAMDARTAPRSFGTPVVRGGSELGELHARVTVDGGQTHVRCDGTQPSLVPSTQSPYEPGSAAIVRSFLPVERAVIACHPPANMRGRLPTHALFSSNGAPMEFTFPGVSVTADQARCVGEALCATRMPAFRAPTASVDYEVLVYMSTAQ